MAQPFTLIDTHTHLYYSRGTPLFDAQLQRCMDNGVRQLLLPNVDRASIPQVLGAVHDYPGNCYAMMGLHPCEVKANYLEELRAIEQIIATNKVYGIGEIGLDLHWDKTTLPLQLEAFRIQVGWAKTLGLPVSIHCRNAFDELFGILEELNDGTLSGVLHCFTGTIEQAHQAIGFGLHLGIGGIVTYKNAGLDQVVAQLDLQRLVLETDSPYLTPVPYRGKPNESSYLFYVAQKIADLHQVPLEQVATVTTETASKLFKI